MKNLRLQGDELVIPFSAFQHENGAQVAQLMASSGGLPPVQLAGQFSYSPIHGRNRLRFSTPELGVNIPSYFRRQTFSQPTTTDVHIDRALTGISIAYIPEGFIGDLVFPRVLVSKDSDKYFIYDYSAMNRVEAGLRAPGARAVSSGYTLTTGSFAALEYSFEHQIPDRVRSNADAPLDIEADGAMFTALQIERKVESLVQTAINTSGNWTTNVTLSGTSQWSDEVNSTPFSVFNTARQTVLLQIGKKPNTIVMGYQVFDTLKDHPDLLNRIKYTGTAERPAMVTAAMMAAMFQVDQVLVGEAVYESATEGATSSPAFMWGKHAWMGYVPANAALKTASAGYTFTRGRETDMYREDATKSDFVRSSEVLAVEVTAAGAGYRIVNAVA